MTDFLAMLGQLITDAIFEAEIVSASMVSRSMREVGLVCQDGLLTPYRRPMVLEVVR
jgi:hypothetical protein